MPPPTAEGGEHCSRVVRPTVRSSLIRTHFAWPDVSVHSGEISVKLATNIHHVSGYCLKGFQCQQSRSRSWTKCTSGWGIRFDCVASSLTCSVCMHYICHRGILVVGIGLCPLNVTIYQVDYEPCLMYIYAVFNAPCDGQFKWRNRRRGDKCT